MNLQFRLYDKEEKRILSIWEQEELGICFDGQYLFQIAYDKYNGSPYRMYPNKYEIQVNTQIPDIHGDPIYEGEIVEQRAVLVGDEEVIIGVVKMLEGAWQIVDEVNERSVTLWSDHRENRIVR